MNDGSFFDLIIIIGFLFFIFSRFFGTKLPKDPKKGNKFCQKPGSNTQNGRIDRTGAKPANTVVEMPRKPTVTVKMNKPTVSPEVLAKLEGAERLKAVDPTFDEKTFISGARQAFNLYWQAVAEYDEETLDALTSPRAFDKIMDRIEPLQDEGKALLTRVDKLESVTLGDTRVNGRTAIAEVKYVAQLGQSEEDKAAKSTDAQAKLYEAVWIWARNVDDLDPNWELDDIKVVN